MRWSRRSTSAPSASPAGWCITAIEPAQYLSIRYTERLAEAGIELSVGSTGDSYDNALAETVIGLFKTEEIYRRGPWKGPEEVEFATLEWVAWYNTGRLEPLGYVPPAEFEQAYHDRQAALADLAVLT
jgi:transposase InsO family protein